jgi:hypothetical protein
VHLVDLERQTVSTGWRPFFPLPADSGILAEWGEPRVNISFDGGPLKLMVLDDNMQPVVREYDRGLALRSRSEAVYQLPSGYHALEALAGIDPAAHDHAEALLVIEADGELLGEWRLLRSEPAKSIHVDVTGKRSLRLLVDYGSGTDAGDVVHICQPRMVK